MLKDDRKPPPLDAVTVKVSQKQTCDGAKKKQHKRRKVYVVKHVSRNNRNEVKKILTQQEKETDCNVFICNKEEVCIRLLLNLSK